MASTQMTFKTSLSLVSLTSPTLPPLQVPTYISVLNAELELEGVVALAQGPDSFPPLPEDVAHPSTAGWLLQTVTVVPSLQMDPGALDALHLLDLEPSHLVQLWLLQLVVIIITDQDSKIGGINPRQQQHLHLLLEVVIIIIVVVVVIIIIIMQMPMSKMEGGANREEEEEVKMMAMVTGGQEKHTTQNHDILGKILVLVAQCLPMQEVVEVVVCQNGLVTQAAVLQYL